MLPKDSATRKELPLYTFLTQFFPDAIAELVKVAVAGNRQHALGETLRWDRNVSTDNLDAALRHVFDHGAGLRHDHDGTLHLAKSVVRLLAEIQLMCEQKQVVKPKLFDERGTRCPDCGMLETQEHRPSCKTMEHLDGTAARKLVEHAHQRPSGAAAECGQAVPGPSPLHAFSRGQEKSQEGDAPAGRHVYP